MLIFSGNEVMRKSNFFKAYNFTKKSTIHHCLELNFFRKKMNFGKISEIFPFSVNFSDFITASIFYRKFFRASTLPLSNNYRGTHFFFITYYRGTHKKVWWSWNKNLQKSILTRLSIRGIQEKKLSFYAFSTP